MGLLGRLMAYITGTSDLPADAVQDWLDAACDMGEGRLEKYAKFEEYYDGAYAVQLRDRTRKYLDISGLGFKENFSDVVVDVLAERLRVVGFTTSEAKTDEESGEISDPIGGLLEEWWQSCRWDGLQNTTHIEALKLGDGGLAVDWNADKGKPEICFNHPKSLKFVYEDDYPDRLAYVTKLWNTHKKGPANPDGREIQRLNIYWPDKIEKWYRLHNGMGEGKGGWVEWRDEGDEAWPVDWTDSNGNPLGIPIFHVKHRAQSRTWGRSRLFNVLPLQDALNKTALDLNELIDNYPYPQRWATGVTGDVDLKNVPGNVWKASGENVKFGELAAAATSEILAALEGLLSRLARQTRVPMHLLTGGENPSGEALKSAESGLVAQALMAQVEFGNAWEGAMEMALKIVDQNGGLKYDGAAVTLPDDLTIDVQWDNPETRSGKEDLEAAILKKQVGVSNYTLIRELGYDPEKEQERRGKEAEAAVETMAKQFNAGSDMNGDQGGDFGGE